MHHFVVKQVCVFTKIYKKFDCKSFFGFSKNRLARNLVCKIKSKERIQRKCQRVPYSSGRPVKILEPSLGGFRGFQGFQGFQDNSKLYFEAKDQFESFC